MTWWVIPVVGAVLAIVIFGFVMGRRLRKQFRDYAAQRGFTFHMEDQSILPVVRAFYPTRAGGSHRAICVVRGARRGLPFVAFRWSYEGEAHSASRGLRRVGSSQELMTIVTIVPRGPAMLNAHPETLGHKIRDALGAEDIDFESMEFSKKYWVTCPNRRFAYDVFHPQMIEWFLQQNPAHWQWLDNLLVMHRPGQMMPPDVDTLLREVDAFVDLIPRHLKYKGRAPKAMLAR